MEERDKYLTEAMGKCWHEYKFVDFEYICKCGDISNSTIALNPKYGTWEAFGKLFEWSMSQKWWQHFIYVWTDDIVPVNISCSLIHPNSFANAIYEFLLYEETSS